jgi:hypothetical protein
MPELQQPFAHTRIAPEFIEESYRDPYRILPRPSFPKGSETRTCPKCGTESVFKPFHLFYRDDASDESPL